MSPTSGSGLWTPITAGAGGGGIGIAQPIPYTLLSLDRFARVMGINPAHFWGASAPNVDPAVMPVVQNCSAIWFKYSWQDTDRVGRLDLAQEIAIAEQNIADAIGYWPAPTWISEDRLPYPRPYMPEMFASGTDVRNRPKSINATYGRIVQSGRRAVSLIGTATTGGGSLAYTDEDGDGLIETATITLATTLTDTCGIKVYQNGTDGDPDWEIREVRSKSISGGILTIVLDAWLLIDPELYEALPTTDTPDLVDIGVTTYFVASVDVYREYADTSGNDAAEFHWEPDYISCAESEDGCEEITQEGCLRIRDSNEGIVVPIPNGNSWSVYREPDYVKLWYLAGDWDIKRPSCPVLSSFWAQTIAWLAASRVERVFCQCGNVESLHNWLMVDLAHNETGSSFFNTTEMIGNPFGTRRGEIAAWRRIARLVKKRASIALA